MSDWVNENQLNYSSGGETADTFIYKTKLTFEQIFELLNILKESMEQTITAEEISAIKNGGNLGKISAGLDESKPTSGNKTNDLYLATNTNTMYRWTGIEWQVILSLNFSQLKNYEAYCINRNEVSTNGKGKILKLDEVTGKANVDITGSPERLLGYEIDVRNLKDNDVLVYNEQKNKIVNLPKDELKKEDVSYSGEPNTIVKVAGDGKAHIDITGDAGSINGLEIEKENAKDGKILSYENGKLVFINQAEIPEENITTTGEAGKIVKVGTDGVIHGSFYLPESQLTTSGEKNKIVKIGSDGIIHGKTEYLGEKKLQISNLKDGDVFVYHKATNTIKNEAKNTVGQGRNLILKDGGRLLGEYNGSTETTVDVASVIAKSETGYINHLLRMVENLYLALEVAGLNFGGYDGAIWSAYSPASKKMTSIDVTNCLVTSIVKGDDSIDVDKIELLTTGENYRLVEGDVIEEVQISSIKPVYDIKRVILTEPVKYQFTPNVARLVRSNMTLDEGKISGTNIILYTKPAEFNIKRTRAHLIVKHQMSGNPNITAEVSFRNSYFDSENFKQMTKTSFYLDQNNTSRATTEFIFNGSCNCSCESCTCCGGMIATIRIKATGTPAIIDSLAVIFNE